MVAIGPLVGFDGAVAIEVFDAELVLPWCHAGSKFCKGGVRYLIFGFHGQFGAELLSIVIIARAKWESEHGFV